MCLETTTNTVRESEQIRRRTNKTSIICFISWLMQQKEKEAQFQSLSSLDKFVAVGEGIRDITID